MKIRKKLGGFFSKSKRLPRVFLSGLVLGLFIFHVMSLVINIGIRQKISEYQGREQQHPAIEAVRISTHVSAIKFNAATFSNRARWAAAAPFRFARVGRQEAGSAINRARMREGSALMDLAEEYIEEEKYRTAIRVYRRAEKHNPEIAPAALYQVAETLKQAEADHSEITRAYLDVLDKYPDSEEVGKALSEMEKFYPEEEKPSFYRGIIGKYLDSNVAVKALDNMARLRAFRRNPQGLFHEIINEFPDSTIAGSALGKMLSGIRDINEVQKTCLKYLVGYPGRKIQITSYEYLVAFAQEHGNLQPFIDLSYALIEDFPDMHIADLIVKNLAEIQYQQGNYVESLRLRASLEK